ncbi:MAG TPA: YegS/Rv2252/BmrU family lipid kinase [Phycisphaerae bacterium]|nr:YegS/Rv2252/BmrU family lipid kinase [Phycisphaerae bacterium]
MTNDKRVKVLAVVNPVSGSCGLSGLLRQVGERISSAGSHMTVRISRAAGRAGHLAAEAPDDTDAILVVGGDGTVREVVDGLMAAGRQVPVAVLPTGTENLVAKELGMPADPATVAATLLRGRPMACDVGVANGRHFLMVTGVGFDAEIVHRVARTRDGHITHLTYFWPVWRTFWTHRFPQLTVQADGECVFEGTGLVIIGVTSRYSAGFKICRQARWDDGMLDLCIYPCRSRPKLLLHALQTVRRCHDRWVGTVYRKCRRVRIDGARTVPLEVDGDPGGHLPAEYTILPSATVFLTPVKP